MKLYLSLKKDYPWSWSMLVGQSFAYHRLRLKQYVEEKKIVLSDLQLHDIAEIMQDFNESSISERVNYFWLI